MTTPSGSEARLARRFIAKWGTGGERGRGICVGCTDQPTLILNLDSGEQIHWIESLCEPEPVEYPTPEPARWVCENPDCRTEFAEYVNGCPKCAEGRIAQGLPPLHFSVREQPSPARGTERPPIPSSELPHGSPEWRLAVVLERDALKQTVADQARVIEGCRDTDQERLREIAHLRSKVADQAKQLADMTAARDIEHGNHIKWLNEVARLEQQLASQARVVEELERSNTEMACNTLNAIEQAVAAERAYCIAAAQAWISRQGLSELAKVALAHWIEDDLGQIRQTAAPASDEERLAECNKALDNLKEQVLKIKAAREREAEPPPQPQADAITEKELAHYEKWAEQGGMLHPYEIKRLISAARIALSQGQPEAQGFDDGVEAAIQYVRDLNWQDTATRAWIVRMMERALKRSSQPAGQEKER